MPSESLNLGDASWSPGPLSRDSTSVQDTLSSIWKGPIDVSNFLVNKFGYLDRIKTLWDAHPNYSGAKIQAFMLRDVKALEERVQLEQKRAVGFWKKDHPSEEYPLTQEALREKILTLLERKFNDQANAIVEKLKKRYGNEYDKNKRLQKQCKKEDYIQQQLEDFPKLPTEQQGKLLSPLSGLKKAALFLLTITVLNAISCGTMQKADMPNRDQGFHPTKIDKPIYDAEEPKGKRAVEEKSVEEITIHVNAPASVAAKETQYTKIATGEKRGVEIAIPGCDPIFYSAQELYGASLEGFKLAVNPKKGICLSHRDGSFYYQEGGHFKVTASLYIGKAESLKKDPGMPPWVLVTPFGKRLKAPGESSLLDTLRALCINHLKGYALTHRGKLPDGYSAYKSNDGAKHFYYKAKNGKNQFIFEGENWGPDNLSSHLRRDGGGVHVLPRSVKKLQDPSGITTYKAKLQLWGVNGGGPTGTLTISPANKTFSVEWDVWPATEK